MLCRQHTTYHLEVPPHFIYAFKPGQYFYRVPRIISGVQLLPMVTHTRSTLAFCPFVVFFSLQFFDVFWRWFSVLTETWKTFLLKPSLPLLDKIWYSFLRVLLAEMLSKLKQRRLHDWSQNCICGRRLFCVFFSSNVVKIETKVSHLFPYFLKQISVGRGQSTSSKMGK